MCLQFLNPTPKIDYQMMRVVSNRRRYLLEVDLRISTIRKAILRS
jgi:hypothetical protein